jgi:hypothetical protein
MTRHAPPAFLSAVAAALALALALASPAALAWPSVPTPPSPADLAKKAAEETKKKADELAAAAAAAFAKTSSTAVAAYNTAAMPVVNKVGSAVYDVSQTLGGALDSGADGTAYPVIKDGKTVAHVVVKDSKIAFTRTLDSAGKVTATARVTGPRFIVSNGQITGREILVGGKVVGEEIISNGKVVGSKAIDTTQYVVSKTGDFVLNGASAEVCKAVMKAVTTGARLELPAVPNLPGLPQLDAFTKTLSEQAAKKQKEAAVAIGAKVQEVATSLGAGYPLPEFDRLRRLSADNSAKVRALFTESTVCNGSPTALRDSLAQLGLKASTPVRKTAWLDLPLPMGPAHAQGAATGFNTYTLSLGAASGGGIVLQLMLATDYLNQTGVYFSLGASVVTNQSAGSSVALGVFPKVEMSSFEGLGWQIGASAGPQKSAVGGAIEFAFNDAFNVLQGFGFGAGVGVGSLPAEVSLTNTYTWKLR